MSVSVKRMLDVAPPWHARIKGVATSIQWRPDGAPLVRHNSLKLMR
jgi:hypothetical protein